MVNTVIQIKYSVDNDKPISLNIAELAYSFTSNTLFLGNTSNGVINVGGVYYTTILDRATSNATTNTLVLRDNHGSALFNVVTANTILGNFVGTLANTGVEAGTYGGATQIPVFTVDDDGRVSYAANVSIATDLTIAADTGNGTISLLTDVLTFSGGDGITTSINPTDNVKFDVDSTVVRTNKNNQVIDGNIQINGNVTVNGNTFIVNVQSYSVEDPIIFLASNNETDLFDIGFTGQYQTDVKRNFGVIRQHNTNNVWIFTNYDESLDNNQLNISNPSLVFANVHTNITGGRVFDLSQTIKVVDGGTGKNTFTTGAILIGNGQGDLLELSNTTSNGTYGNSNFVPVVTIDEYGRVSSITTEAIFENAIIDCGTY